MERLTEHVGDCIRIKGCSTIYADAERKGAPASNAIVRLSAYEDTRLGPEEITTEPYGCVFYCNRKCNLDGDFCAEGPGCPYEINTETAKHLLKLAQSEKDGRLVVLPEGTESMMMAGFVANGNEMLYPVMETKGNPEFIPAILSLMIESVSVANGISYDMLLSALIDNPPVTACKQDADRKAEAALKKREADNEAS